MLDLSFLTAETPGSQQGEIIGLNFNFANKILIISTIMLFHLIPFLINKSIYPDLKKKKENFFISLFNIFLFVYFILTTS